MSALLPGQVLGAPWGWGRPVFDYYSASVYGVELDQAVSAVVRELGYVGEALVGWSPCRAKNGYLRGVSVHRGPRVFCEVWSGGNPGTHFLARGADTPLLVPGFRRQFPRHSVARADVRFDWISAGLFELLDDVLVKYAHLHGLKLDQAGDWSRSDGARTRYFLSRNSSVYVCLYEKGKKEGGSASPHWVRLEVRVAPHSTQKEACSVWSEEEFLGASFHVRRVFDQMGVIAPPPTSVSRPWRDQEEERARLWLLKQGGRVLKRWLAEEGGSPEALGVSLVSALLALEERGLAPEVLETLH